MDPKEEVRHRLPVEEVVGEYLELKPAGGASLKTCCPFHGEKTPSFYVSKEKQIWHCFGCDKGGDIFAFVMEMEGLEFPEALRLLAKKAGVEIPRYDSTESNERSRLVEMNELARKFYEKVYLESETAKTARDYVASRGIDVSLRESFGLGYAPDSWDRLVSFLSKRGFSNQEIVSAGLALHRKQGSGVIDRFRDRLMIPLFDVHGNAVAFTGRILPSLNSTDLGSPAPGPKYMNSPETGIYHKGELLYGLSKAKQMIKREKAVIIVEGNLDVIASHKAGVEHVVASSGTALTEAQIKLLQRYTNKLIFCFDQDSAGFQAALRGIRLATEMGCDVKVLLIPADAGKDPDEVVQKDPELWRKVVASPISIMEYYFAHATHGKDLSEVDVKREVGNFLVGEIGRLKDPIEMEHWLAKLGGLLRMDPEVLRKMISTSKSVGEPRASLASKQPHHEKTSRLEKTFEVLLALLMQCPKQGSLIFEGIQDAWIPQGDQERLYRLAQLSYDSTRKDSALQKSLFSALEAQVGTDVELTRLLHHVSLIGERLASELSETETRSYIEEHLRVLEGEWKKLHHLHLQQELRAAEARGDEEAVKAILEQFQQTT